MGDVDFDALPEASGPGTLKVTALRQTLSDQERQRLHTAVERVRETAELPDPYEQRDAQDAYACAVGSGTAAGTVTAVEFTVRGDIASIVRPPSGPTCARAWCSGSPVVR
ncbi:hypothetical protein ACQEWB_49605 [Streptomyces sp. CA-249302]|uniref:hypothetical protein n=1 Tax=Streptomyces sp. CA-249302 TaxID=3240058 RepID=UPI003D8ABC76